VSALQHVSFLFADSTAGCVDTDLPVGQCNYAHSDKSVSETAWLHHAMWVDHSETCCRWLRPYKLMARVA
jgi:hypothetical protein